MQLPHHTRKDRLMTMRDAKKEAHRIVAELIQEALDEGTWKDRLDSHIEGAAVYRVKLALTALTEAHERHAP